MIGKHLKTIADHYGLDAQLDMLQEECAELIQAASKYKRYGNYSIIEEMADVYIMLDQVAYLLDKEVPGEGEVKYSISWWKKKKITRQLERIEKEIMTNGNTENILQRSREQGDNREGGKSA